MKEKLLALAAQYDIPLTAAGAAALCGYLERLLETNRVMNLTAITDPDEALCKHLLDCLVAAALPEMAGRVADVGAGAGFPSVVIKALRPECEITALDATGKKLDFVASASAALQALGGELLRAQTVTLPDGSQRVNLVIKKARPTPKSYPRRQKDIKARPLG